MSVQQMMFKPALAKVSISGSPHVSYFQNEPAPPTQDLSTSSVTAVVSGNIGTPTYSWTFLSGDSSVSISSSSTASVWWSGNIPKNSQKSALWRCTITVDGQVLTVDADVFLQYTTDLI